MVDYKFNFNRFFKFFNVLSLVLIIISITLLIFKGLNFGVDFKGGTLIELRATDKQITISQVRQSFLNMNTKKDMRTVEKILISKTFL